MRSTTQLRSVWAPPCQLRPSGRFTFWSGVPVTVDGRIVPALRVLDDCLRRHDYRPRQGQTWGYNCRKITGGSGYSLHAYGIAVDINSLANPYGPRLVTDMPMAMVEEIEAIGTNGGHRVWGWGGRYARNKDAMHFEVVASPAELALGIDGEVRIASAQRRTPKMVLFWHEGAVYATDGLSRSPWGMSPGQVDALVAGGAVIVGKPGTANPLFELPARSS